MRKTILIGVGVLVGIALLAGAAFLGARLLVPQAANNPNGGPGNVRKAMGGPGGEGVTIERKKAEELPDREPDINGEVSEMKDNSMMVTPINGIMITMNQDGESSKNVEYAGAAVEVVVTQETQLYRDVTENEFPLEEPTESMVIEQKLEAAEFSQVGTGGIVMVWGYKRGDRLIAETIVLEILPE